jgi:hypothetical protein
MDEAVSDTQSNACATAYVTADNSSPVAYIRLTIICKWKNKDWSLQIDVYFILKIKLYTV